MITNMERTYTVMDGQSGRITFSGHKKFALTYDGNCEECAWLESGYCPCVVEYHPAGEDGKYVTPEGKTIPVLVVGPRKDSPKECWE